VPELRRQADLVIAVTHIGVEEDKKMAAEVPGIDVIVGGHSHTLLPQPLLVTHPNDGNPDSIQGTVIVQDFQWGGTLGRLDLTLHRNAAGAWAVKAYKGELLPVLSSVQEDPKIAEIVSRYWDPIKGKYAEVIAEAEGDFAEKGGDHAEYNLVADAVRERMGVEFDLENMGGVRAPLAKGPITYGDMITMDPFGNTIVTFRATGRQLKEILAKNRPAVSGIRYVYDKGMLTESSIGGKPIEDEKVYSGTTNNYYANFILKDISDKTDTKKPRLDEVLAWLRTKKTVLPAYDRRRVIKGIGDFD
jgi:2',3'-cyclic-nucleotide 2'-phosphodiesterase (5'-nucleotidase family)